MKLCMHNWMRPEPIEVTIRRLGRFGYDGIEISGEPARYDRGHVKALLEDNAPYQAKVTFESNGGATGWNAPDTAPW